MSSSSKEVRVRLPHPVIKSVSSVEARTRTDDAIGAVAVHYPRAGYRVSRL